MNEKGHMVARFTLPSAMERHSWLTDLAKLKIIREMSRKKRAGASLAIQSSFLIILVLRHLL